MTKLTAALLLSACLIGLAAAEDYQNPIVVQNDAGQVMDAADPFVLRFNGRYYLYTTGAENIRVYESDDLVHWTFEGHCTQNGEVRTAYAPEVFYWRGMFYMITSPAGNGHYILRSDSPLGPFEKVTENFGYSIDGSLFATDDGGLWMLCLDNNAIAITAIDPDALTPTGVKFTTGVTLNHWTEGPGLLRRGEWYYLTLTGNHFLSTGYRVAWASRKSDPIGRYTHPADHTLLINSVFGDDFTGLGHSANFYGPDLESVYTSYHCHAPSGTGSFSRWYNLDRLLTNGGMLYTTGPTNTAMPVPAMPDVYGDAQGDLNGFTFREEGYMAEIEATERFTQECSFILNGGEMVWRLGSRDGEPAMIRTDGSIIMFSVNDEVIDWAAVPELGAADRLHTLRVECTQDVLYVSIDTMRLLTVETPQVTADTIGALTGEHVEYSFLAHTSKALGDGDKAALKTIPGTFAAVHSVKDVTPLTANEYEAQAALLGEGIYPVRVAEDGDYCFSLTVRAEDAGKQLFLSVGNASLTVTIPECPEQGDAWFTCTTEPMTLTAGDYGLTIRGADTALLTVESFAWSPVEDRVWNLAMGDREGIITLGNFMARDGALAIRAGRTGFALLGDEGWTDVEMRVKFQIPVEGTGACGFLMRATDVSLYDAQVAESAFAYAISVSKLGINVKRWRYGAAGAGQFYAVSAWAEAEKAELILRAEGGELQVFLPDSQEPLAVIREAQPLTHGLCGLYSTGKELTVTALSVLPLEE